MEDYILVINTDDHRFEFYIDDSVAFIEYKLKGDDILLMHTEVPEALQGIGIGYALILKAFQEIEQKELRVVPLCPFIKSFLRKNPDWNRLL